MSQSLRGWTGVDPAEDSKRFFVTDRGVMLQYRGPAIAAVA